MSEATAWTGTATPDSGGVKVTSSDEADPELVPIEIAAVRSATLSCAELRVVPRELKLELSPDALRHVSAAVVTEVDLVAAQTRLGFGRPRVARTRFVRAAALRCVRVLEAFLSDEQHLAPVEGIVRSWLDAVRPGEEDVDFDPAELGEQVAAALRRNAKLATPEYEDVGTIRTFEFPGFVGREEVMLAPGVPPPTRTVADLPVFLPSNFQKGQLYRGWTRCAHEACAFDSEPEALFAKLLDQASDVDWWVRNAPVRMEIETPAGRYRPDFLVKLAGEAKAFLILEGKADNRWQDPEGDERLKNAAAREWTDLQRKAGYEIRIGVALENDIRRSASWAELQGRLR